MLEKTKDFIETLGDPKVDPSIFNHPLALKISWEPIAGSGFTFKAHVFDKSNPNKWVIKRSKKLIFFSTSLVVVGLALTDFAHTNSDSARLNIAAACLILLGIMYYIGTRRSFKIDFLRSKLHNKKQIINLNQIGGIQIIEYWTGGKNSRKTFQMNLALNDATRIFVMSNGNREHILNESTALAQALGCAVWDGSREGLKE